MTGRESPGPSRWLRGRTAVLDRIAALALALPLAPVALLLAWGVRRADGPPAMVALVRVGRDGTRFDLRKLRTMRVAAAGGAAGGPAITAAEDDRITPMGARLRRWRLDELPNLLNVLRGEMGLLGPRPETPDMVDLADPRWQAVLRVRPGISGPTQLVIERWEVEVLHAGSQEDVYARTVLPVKLAVDAWYVANASLPLDVRVLWSMAERFVLGRTETSIERVVRAAVPETAAIPPQDAP